jgi:hypothetical protein
MPPAPAKHRRRLNPEAAAQLAARRRQAQVEELYQKPVTELSREELALMRAAFVLG